MEKLKKLKFIDWLVIILNVSYHLTMVKVYTFDLLPLQPFITLLFFTAICYIFRFKSASLKISRKQNLILIVFFSIYFFDVLQCMVWEPLSALLRLITAIEIFIFLAYLYQLWNINESYADNVSRITKPYVYFCLYNVAVVLIVAFLSFSGIINPESNPIGPNSLTKVDAESGQIYYFPYYLSLTTSSFRILGSMGLPMITGLTHEPHVFCFLVLPSLFLILAYREWGNIKYAIYFVYFLVFIINFSTTALMALSAVLFTEMMWLITKKRRMSAIIPAVVVIALFVMYAGEIIDLMSDEVVRKTVDSTSSMEYSTRMLKYMISPHFILGSGNMPHDLQHNANADIGLITFLLDAVLVLYIVYTAVKMTLSRNERVHYIGMACMYLLIHSTKTNMLNFNYPYFALFMFVMAVFFSYTKRNTAVAGKIRRIETKNNQNI